MSATLALTKYQRTSCEETYHDVENLIYDLCWQFKRKFGGDINELIADANTHFMRAYQAQSFDPSKSKFSTWVSNIVWRGLLCDHTRDRTRRVQVIASEKMDLNEAKLESKLLAAMAELTGDAATVLRLVVDMPEELAAASRARGGQPRNIRSALREYLAGIGWSYERVAESFDEIRSIL